MTRGELVAHNDPAEDVLTEPAALARPAPGGISAAEGTTERLALRVHELETHIKARRFQEIERMQLGRMLAAAESRRIERLRRPLLSGWTTLLLLYAAVLGLLAVVLWLRWLYG